jgi:hypothetical protein
VSKAKGSRFKKIARECYERILAESGGRCDVEDIRDAILREILSQGVSDDIVDDFVDGLLKEEDDRRASAADTGQMDIFSGEPAALDAVWRLGGGERVLARHATRADCYARLGLKAQNVARVTESFAREQERLAKLMPYMPDDTVTIETALDAWRRDNS